MARRSSARLRAKVSATPQVRAHRKNGDRHSIDLTGIQPQKVSNFDQDAIVRTPKTAPKLTTLAESDEMPGAFPRSTSPAENTPSRLAEHIAQAITGEHATPKHTTPIKPSAQEMHPQKYQMSTARPLDEARWLGFSSMAPHTEPAKGPNRLALAQGTPTKAHAVFEAPKKFDFTFSRPSLGLSPEARQLMAEKRDEAAKIKEQMQASEEAAVSSANDLLARKMATPKGKMGRFSDVHMNSFNKMESIAGHPSAFRADADRPGSSKGNNTLAAAATSKTPKKPSSTIPTAAPKSLKRTQSKAELTSSALPRATSKPDLSNTATKHAASKPDSNNSPAKRVKRAIDDDVATTRPQSSSSDTPSTPQHTKSLKLHSANPHLHKGLSTPTASSLARAASVKSIKRTMIPALTRSPSKAAPTAAAQQQPKPSTPLLARSPSKLTLPGTIAAPKQSEPQSPLLSRSAIKPTIARSNNNQDNQSNEQPDTTRYLSRSPTKMSAASKGPVDTESIPDKTPLLSRSPSKIAIPDAFSHTTHTPAKSTATNLMTRFNLLRASPMKSILRTPQRLYSNDPVKIASGTHFATPEKATQDSKDSFLKVPPKTAPVQKHVDFSASTKGFESREQKPDTPSKKPAEDVHEPESPVTTTAAPAQQTVFAYPSLPPREPSLKKSHRRMTMALPSDFTFRAGGEITFAPSPGRKDTDKTAKPSIRHVSADPEVAPASSKKRKFSGMDDTTIAVTTHKHESSDKENGGADESSDDEQRPAKKSRPNAPEVAPTPHKTPAKTPRKYSTLGVKPKSTQKPREKQRPGLLSQARLNALATPKRR